MTIIFWVRPEKATDIFPIMVLILLFCKYLHCICMHICSLCTFTSILHGLFLHIPILHELSTDPNYSTHILNCLCKGVRVPVYLITLFENG